MTIIDWELGKGYLETIEKLDDELARAQQGIRVQAQAQDLSQFIDLPALQGTLEAAIQQAIDDNQALFDAL